MKITITNNLRITEIPPELYRILVEDLEITNPKWLENNRMGRWNRGTPKMIRFYDKIKNSGLWIPRGYIRHLINLCIKHNVPYQVDDKRRCLPEVEFSFNGKLKSFQQEAVRKMMAKDFGVLNAPTGSGKTIMALYMITQRRQPALIVVHTKDLAFQWMERINTFLGISEDDVGLVGSGKKKIGEKITVALVQSLYKYAEEVSLKTGFLIVDESHRCPSRTFTEAVTAFDSRYMMGMSATPWRRDKLSKLIFWHLGDMHFSVEKKRLIEKGHILEAEIITRETDFETSFNPVHEYSRMLSELTADQDRNVLIASDIFNETKKNRGVCLVLSDRKTHCENLRFILQHRFKTSSDVLTGDLTGKDRRDIIEKLNEGKVTILIATGQLVGEGFDCKDLTTLFLATPIRFSGRVLQYLGRVLRSAPGKKKARVYDYIDGKVDILRSAAKARERVYQSSA